MKRFLKFLAISFVVVASAFGVFEFSNQYRMSVLKNNLEWSIAAKNCAASQCFTKDDSGNTYIAYNNYIKSLKEDGREEVLLEDDELKINDILFFDNKLYILSKDKLLEFDMDTRELKGILKNIPYKGEFMDRNMIIKDSKILLSIGVATNSGIADAYDDYNTDDIAYDRSPINITLNGVNYGTKKTGAFMPYGNSSFEGQKIEASKIADASIIQIELNSKKVSLYACGIRNIKGWDVDSSNNLFAIVGGMEDKGSRPVKRDCDYLYKIDKGKWYGWPDFSGGDPINSPRFKSEKTVLPIIANPPNKIVAAPEYQYLEPGIIKYMAIDKYGDVLEKDSKIFLDCKDNMIKAVSNEKVVYNLLKLKEESDIKGIEYSNGSIYILDSGIGCIYKLQSDNLNLRFSLPKSIWIFLIIFSFSLVCLVIVKNKKKN